MKKFISISMVLILLVSSMLVLVGCGGKAQLPEAPNGYLWYENDDIYFAYPEALQKTEQGTYVQLSPKDGGNNITVARGAYDSSFDNMDVEAFRTHLKPALTQAGMVISNEKVTHNNEKGFDIAVITYDISYIGVSMEQMLYMFKVGNYVYTITITALSNAEDMIETLFDTLTLK